MELKILGLAMYFQTSSFRRTARVLSELRRVSKTAVWKWVVKLKQRLANSFERKPRKFIVLDETCVNVNGEGYWVYSALDVLGFAMASRSSRLIMPHGLKKH